MNDESRKLAFWGIGSICNQFIENNPHLIPNIFIDSNAYGQVFKGKHVIRPDEIDNFSLYKIIVTVNRPETIFDYLKEKGLRKNRDFYDYREYFGGELVRTRKCVQAICESRLKYTIVLAPIFIARQQAVLSDFYCNYAKSHKKDKLALLCELGSASIDDARKLLNCEVFQQPEVFRYTGKHSEIYMKYTSYSEDTIDEDNNNWLRGFEAEKINDNYRNAYLISKDICLFFKDIIEHGSVEKMLIWGPWLRSSLIAQHCMDVAGIDYRFIEYGYIPGTIQIGKLGLAGTGEYAQYNADQLLSQCDIDDKHINEIINYIKVNRVDSGKFRNTQQDEKQLKKLNQKHKTVFLVGIGDEIIGFKGDSSFWRENVSRLFCSSLDALRFILGICRKENWNMIFKPHPSEYNNKAFEEYRDLDDLVLIHDMSIDEILEKTDVVVSIVSSVDYKALMFGVPLVKIGQSSLNHKKCTYEACDIDEIEDLIKQALMYGMTDEQKEYFRIHLKHLLSESHWDNLSHDELPYGRRITENFFRY